MFKFLAFPPLEHPQRAERIPAAGGAQALKFKVGLAFVSILQKPAAVPAPGGADDANRLGEARVPGSVDGLEVIEGAQDVVVPPRREGEANENRLDDLAGAIGAEEPVHEKEFPAAALRHADGAHIASPVQFVRPQAFEDAAALGKCFELHGTDIYRALLHYERVRYYRATRFQFASKFLFKHLEPADSPQRRQILAAVNERDYPVFDHTERAGSDDSWIYAFDAREIGDKLPLRKLGPWDFRSRTKALGSARQEIARSLWKPAKSWTGDRPVTREELAQHTSFDDCWVVIRGKVYDFTEWKDHHPGGPFVARIYGGKDATAEFGEYHSRLAERHMEHFCVGPLVGAPAERAGDAV